MRKYFLAALLLVALQAPAGRACTNFLFSKGSTADGSTMITYAADSHTRYGQLRYSPAADHRPGEMLDIYDYGSLRYLLSIPQPAHTYNVVGFINEHQLAIGETTWVAAPSWSTATRRASTTATSSMSPSCAPATAARPSRLWTS